MNEPNGKDEDKDEEEEDSQEPKVAGTEQITQRDGSFDSQETRLDRDIGTIASLDHIEEVLTLDSTTRDLPDVQFASGTKPSHKKKGKHRLQRKGKATNCRQLSSNSISMKKQKADSGGDGGGDGSDGTDSDDDDGNGSDEDYGNDSDFSASVSSASSASAVSASSASLA
eukprot:scaffold185252_cov35-Attheya_sp.AAC.1